MNVFIDNMSIYLKKNSPEIDGDFIEEFLPLVIYRKKCKIDFDNAYKWIGYSTKQNAKNMLIKHFTEHEDYTIESIEKVNLNGGQNKEIIKITSKTFEQMGMLAKTKKGDQIREYMSTIHDIIIDMSLNNMLRKDVKMAKKIYEFDINDYYNKELVYLIHVKKNIYKFGITDDIKARLLKHTKTLNHKFVVKLWKTPDRSYSTNIENKIKEIIKVKGVGRTYKKHTEIFETCDIQKIIKYFDKYANIEHKQFKENQMSFRQKVDLEIQNNQLHIINGLKDIQSKLDNPDDLIKLIKFSKINIDIDDNKEDKQIEEEEEEEEEIIKDTKPNIKKNDDLIEEMEEDMENFNKCNKCRKLKDKEEFYSTHTKKYCKWCNVCRKKDRTKPSRQPDIKKKYNEQYAEKNKEQIKLQQKGYGAKNKEKKKEYNKQYREKNKEELIKKDKEKYEKNKEKKLKQKKEYYQKNKEEIRKKQKEYYDIQHKKGIS